jgi:hypothetical protein
VAKVNKWREKFMLEVLLFSMMSVKVLCHNIFLMRRFISILGIEPDKEINRKLWEEGIRFGKGMHIADCRAKERFD